MKFIKTLFIPFTGYTLITLFMTYPVAFKINKGFAGVPGYGDSFDFLWIFWWVKHSITELKVNPYFTDYLYYPKGLDLSTQTLTFFNSLIAIFLQYFFSLITCYNILFLFSFIMSGIGAYLLIYYLTKDKISSFICGVIFSFCPYHFAHGLAHLNILSIEWLPFYILFLIKTFKENKKLNGVFLGIFLTLNSLCDWYYTVYLLIFTFFYLIYTIIFERNLIKNGLILRFLVASLTFTFLIFPFVYPLLKNVLLGKSYIIRKGYDTFSADLFGYITPSILHPIWGKFFGNIINKFSGNINESIVYIGIIPLILFIYSLFLSTLRNKTRFWIISAFSFLILSFGPTLHILGKSTSIKLPFLLFENIPFLNLARVASRFSILVMISLVVISGYALNEIFSNFKKIKRKFITSIIITLLVIIDFLSIPFPMIFYQPHKVYETLKNDSNDFKILELPFDPQLFNSIYLYHQTIHNKKMLTGFTGRVPQESFNFIKSLNLLSILIWPYLSEKNLLSQEEIRLETKLLEQNKIKFIIITKDWFEISLKRYYKNPEVLSKSIYNLLDNSFKKIEDKSIKIYQIY